MDIELSLPREHFAEYTRTVIETHFPDRGSVDLSRVFDDALERLAVCFSNIALGGYSRNGRPYLNHLHGDQTAAFWYILSNCFHARGERALAEKCMLINKARNGILIMYDTALPERFLLIHTVGTMLGKATYGEYLVVTQNVTVGTNRGNSPTFGRGVILYPHCVVLGRSTLGDFARVAAGTMVMDTVCPPRSVISRGTSDITIHPSNRETISEYFTLPAG